MNRIKLFLTILSVSCLSACSNEKEQLLENQVAALSNQVENLSKQMAWAKESITSLVERVGILNFETQPGNNSEVEVKNWVGDLEERYRTVQLNVSDKGYYRI